MDRNFETDKVKASDDYLVEQIDLAINELVVNNYSMAKAYNYYNGIRDADQFKHLEENYGIGTATSIEFTPLIKKHIDSLVGEYLSLELNPKVSCKDESTLNSIFREKQVKIISEVTEVLKPQLNNALFKAMSGDSAAVNDIEIERKIAEIKSDLENNFISDYEIAGQDVINYICQSRSIDLKDKLKRLILHLLISGSCYYRIKLTPEKNNIELEILNPLNTFIDRNLNSPYVKDSYRAVHRKYMSKMQILADYGSFLTKEHIEILETMTDEYYDETYARYVNAADLGGAPLTENLTSGMEITTGISDNKWSATNRNLLPVYETEILSTTIDKKTKQSVMHRHEGIRIGTEIYILTGEPEHVMRSMSTPNKCGLSLNGMYNTEENGKPYSLMLKTAHLQDKYDILHFFRDNIIANSGTVGDWLDVATLPTFLGEDVAERMMKWIAYKKQGVALIDSSQEGQAMNTTFSGFDDSVKVNAIQAIEMTLDSIESTASSITGIFKERIGGIEQRDAVTNVQVGVKQSMFVTKQYYQRMDLLTRDILIDSLDLSKIAYKKGLTGTLILGEYKQKIFTALPEHFTITDFDVHIADSSKIIADLETVKQLTFELAKGGSVEPEVLIDSVTARSMTDIKQTINGSLKRKKEENNAIQQLQQQVEQANQASKKYEDMIKKLQTQLEKVNTDKVQLEQDKFKADFELKWAQQKQKKEKETRELDLKEELVEAEKLQLLDDNLNNNEIKNNV